MAVLKEHFRALLLNQNTDIQFVNALFDSVRQSHIEETNLLLDLIQEEHKKEILLRHAPEQETVLHTAVKARVPASIISRLIDACPILLQQTRGGSETYRGQTALHIAITQGNLEIIELILSKTENFGAGKKRNLLHQIATGSKFVNTCMMGELPLTVAALTLNTIIVDALLKHGAELSKQNSSGDNVCHSLIKYAHLYPEKVSEVMKICEHIFKQSVLGTDGKAGITDTDKCSDYIWLMGNSDGLNPLKLSAELGQHLIFKYIMELKGVYCYINSEDGLFDVKVYDVTDIDAVSELKFPDVIPVDIDMFKPISESNSKKQRLSFNRKLPMLETIFNSDASIVFKFIQMSPLHYVINRKWEFYKWFYLVWGILHMLFMIGYSVYAVERSKLPRIPLQGPVSDNYLNQIDDSAYVTFYVVLSMVVSGIYLFQEFLRIIKRRMPWTLLHVMNCYHNGPFRIVLILFSLCVIADFVWRMTDENYENYLLVCAMILGWWFLVFFLRGLRQFSFFTVMIQKVLVGDMFRFSIIIGMELVAFTTGMYIVFQGAKTTDDNVEHYGKLIVLMFKMMFGFASFDVLFEARQSWFAVCIYTAFVLLTYVLMINSLIAMMSNTCSVVSQNRQIQWRVQQLSIVLFFESFLPSCCLKLVGQPRDSDWYDPTTQRYTKKQRYFMEVRSLMEVTRSKSRLRLSPETMIESIFNTIREIQLPSFGIFEDEAKESKRHNEETVETARETVRRIPDTRDKHKLNENDKLNEKHKLSEKDKLVRNKVSEDDDREPTSTKPKEKKKRKKNKKITVEPEHENGEHGSSRMTEVEYLSSTLISPDLDKVTAIDRNIPSASFKPFSSLEIHNL